MSDQLLAAFDKLNANIESKGAKADKDLAEMKSAFEKEAAEKNQKITEFTEELQKKGATIEQMQCELKELKAKGGRFGAGKEFKDLKSQVADVIVEHKSAFEGIHNGGYIQPIQFKTVGNIASANLTGTGNNYISYMGWQEGMEPIDQARFRSFVRTVNSETDFVRYPRANVPVGEGSFARITEAAAKPQVDRDYTMIDLTLKPMAGYAIVSRQSLRNIVFLQSWLPTSMQEQLLDSEDTDFANTLVAAATGSTTSSGANEIEKIIDYITRLRMAKHTPNGIAIDPLKWGAIIKTTQTNAGYNLPNVVTVDASGTVRILGIPVVPVNWLTGSRVIVGDWRKAAIVQSEGLVLRQTDSHASTFTTNEVTFLLERTEGLMINRTEAFTTAVL